MDMSGKKSEPESMVRKKPRVDPDGCRQPDYNELESEEMCER